MSLPTLTADMRVVDVPGLKGVTLNALTADYATVRDVAMAPDTELLRLPGFGKACLRNLREHIPTWIETPMRAERCDACRFWDGLCRRHAPQPSWPSTKANDWCGEFITRRKIDAKAEPRPEASCAAEGPDV